ncbi:MAG: response regulator [Nitrospirae bacterium]|nr:response regulator [Nitrospirota bacterium]
MDSKKNEDLDDIISKVQKLEAISLLTAGIAHDFNNMLTSILGNISLVKSQLREDDWCFERLTEAEKASLQAKELSSQLLTFVRERPPVKKIASITELLSFTVPFVLRGYPVQCQLAFSKNIWPVEIDESQITRVIQNLVINARQANPEGGVIQVHAENMNVANPKENGLLLEKGKYVKVSIRDHGYGIPKEDLPKIFEPFFTTKSSGNGLGLATSYSIIQRHGGTMTAESSLKTGTIFSFFIPAVIRRSSTLVKEKNTLIKGQGRVLVIDDQENVLQVASEMLKHLGYDSEIARTGTEGLIKTKRAKELDRSFELIITELNLPGEMTGIEMLEKAKEIDPQIKFILSSGYTYDSAKGLCQYYGFSGALRKPYSVHEMGSLLHEVMELKPSS